MMMMMMIIIIIPSSNISDLALNTIRNHPGSVHLISDPGVIYTLCSINSLKRAKNKKNNNNKKYSYFR